MADVDRIPATPVENAALGTAVELIDRVTGASWAALELAEPPLSGSDIAIAYRAVEREAFDLARLLLYAARDHMRTISLIIKAENIPSFALLTLLRGAAEAAIQARHLLDPAVTHQIRLGRALTVRMKSLEEHGKLHKSFESPSQKQIGRLEARAASCGVVVVRDKHGKAIGFGDGYKSEVELFQLYFGGNKGELGYRLLSGFAHSQPWTTLRRSAEAKPTNDPHVGTLPTDLPIPMLCDLIDDTMTLFDQCGRSWLLLAGIPGDVWPTMRDAPLA